MLELTPARWGQRLLALCSSWHNGTLVDNTFKIHLVHSQTPCETNSTTSKMWWNGTPQQPPMQNVHCHATFHFVFILMIQFLCTPMHCQCISTHSSEPMESCCSDLLNDAHAMLALDASLVSTFPYFLMVYSKKTDLDAFHCPPLLGAPCLCVDDPSLIAHSWMSHRECFQLHSSFRFSFCTFHITILNQSNPILPLVLLQQCQWWHWKLKCTKCLQIWTSNRTLCHVILQPWHCHIRLSSCPHNASFAHNRPFMSYLYITVFPAQGICNTMGRRQW